MLSCMLLLASSFNCFLSSCMHTPFCAEKPGNISPGEVLAFVTGCPVIPPMGYPRPLKITFITDKTRKFPTANTCGPHLNLPLALVDYSEFKEKLDFSFSNTVGFGQV